MKQLKRVFIVLCLLCVSMFYADYARAAYAVPGCQDAWNAIASVSQLENLGTLVKTDCAVMYRKGWRLPLGNNTGGTSNVSVCAPAWNSLVSSGKIENAKFIVTHNCPVLYRKGWVS